MPLAFGVDHPWVLVLLVPALAPAFFAWRQLRSSRARTSSLLRSLTLVCLVAALAGTVGLREREGLAVVAAIDDSLSVAGRGRALSKQLRAVAREQLGPNDRYGVLLFGRDVSVDAEPAPATALRPLESTVDRSGSHPAEALALAEAILPEAAERRVVLISDGRETAGDLAAAAKLAGARGVRLDAVAVGAGALDEAYIEDLVLPGRVPEGERFSIEVTVRSSVPQRATVRLVVEGAEVGTRSVGLNAEQGSRVAFRIRAGAGGFFRVKAYLEPTLDTYSANNTVAAFLEVSGEPRVLRMTQDPTRPSILADTLRAAGFGVHSTTAIEAPEHLQGYAPYAAVVMEDVAAFEFSDQALAAIRDYVRELGGGLAMLGSERSFAPGGYHDTPIEEALPVEMRIKNKRFRMPTSLVLVIDRSGSMAGVGRSASKMDLAKVAAGEVLGVMEPDDRIGVVAFDSSARWVSKIRPVSEARAIRRTLGTIHAGGGTDFTPGLAHAYQALRKESSKARNVLLVTDGHSVPGAFNQMARAAHEQHGITTSTVGIGRDADDPTLRRLAKRGGGQFYAAHNAHRLPRIFVREAVLAARSHLVEEPFIPSVRGTGALVASLANPPEQLDGFVATTLKPRAELHLGAIDGQPLLASWRYGLGRAIAFTSDAGGAWSSAWTNGEDFAPFWRTLIRWIVRDDDAGGLVPKLTVHGDTLAVQVDAFDGNGNFRNLAPMRAAFFPPTGPSFEVPLAQTAPGRYEVSVEGGRWSGALVHLRRYATDDAERPVESRLVPAPAVVPAELRGFGVRRALLEEATAATGGRVLSSLEAIFESPGDSSQERLPLGKPLLSAALILLLVDVAVRRIQIPTLRRSRSRSPEDSQGALGGRGRTPRVEKVAQPSTAAIETRNRVLGDTPPVDDLEQTVPESAAPPADPDSYTGRLLAAKRRSRGRQR